jgi:hypothetical protein
MARMDVSANWRIKGIANDRLPNRCNHRTFLIFWYSTILALFLLLQSCCIGIIILTKKDLSSSLYNMATIFLFSIMYSSLQIGGASLIQNADLGLMLCGVGLVMMGSYLWACWTVGFGLRQFKV